MTVSLLNLKTKIGRKKNLRRPSPKRVKQLNLKRRKLKSYTKTRFRRKNTLEPQGKTSNVIKEESDSEDEEAEEEEEIEEILEHKEF